MSFFELIHGAAQRCDAIFRAGTGMPPRQYTVLRHICEHPGINQTDLVKGTGIDRSTAAEMLARMERDGFVERRLAEGDARIKTLHMTPKGEEALHAARQPALRAEEQVAGMLGDELQPALAALKKIGNHQPGASA